MTIWDVLDKVNVEDGTNGIDSGNLYCTLTLTRFPGALQVPELHDDHVAGVPEFKVNQVVVAVRSLAVRPGYPRVRRKV